MSRLSYARSFRPAALAGALALVLAWWCPAGAEVQLAPGQRLEVVATGIPRPVQLTLDRSGGLVILSHGWRGDAAAEVYRVDLAGLPRDASRAPRVVIPFAEGPRKLAFGSLAIDPRSGDLFLGEENGNRIYRLTAEGRLTLFAAGLDHLVGGSSLAFDDKGRLVALDYASPEGQLRSEAPPPGTLDWLSSEAYHGPLVYRVDPQEDIPGPRRLDLVAPLFPEAPARRPGVEPMFRLVSVASAPSGELFLLSSIGEVFRLDDHGLRRFARLPSGHYHRTHMAVASDESVFVSTGFHIRQIFRISPAGTVTTVAWDLGDPGGIAVDRAGSLYIAEGAVHRIIRISPAP